MKRALVCWLRVVGRAMEGFSLAKRVRRRSDVSFWAVEFATFHPSTRFRVSRVLLFLVFLGIRNDSDVRRQLRSQRFSFFFGSCSLSRCSPEQTPPTLVHPPSLQTDITLGPRNPQKKFYVPIDGLPARPCSRCSSRRHPNQRVPLIHHLLSREEVLAEEQTVYWRCRWSGWYSR